MGTWNTRGLRGSTLEDICLMKVIERKDWL